MSMPLTKVKTLCKVFLDNVPHNGGITWQVTHFSGQSCHSNGPILKKNKLNTTKQYQCLEKTWPRTSMCHISRLFRDHSFGSIVNLGHIKPNILNYWEGYGVRLLTILCGQFDD